MAFAGLYGDLPSAKDQPSDDADKEKKKEGWAGSGLFAPTNLGGKRQAALAPPSVLRAAASGGGRGRGREGPPPVAPGGRGGGRGSASRAEDGGSVLLAAASSGDGPITVTATAVPMLMPGISLGEDIKDEYDPSKPNDYDAVRRDRERQRRDAEVEAARQERLREEQEAQRQRQRQEEARRQEEEERLREMRELEALELAAAGEGGEGEQQGAAGPSMQQQPQTEEQRRAALQLSGEEAWKRRGMAAAAQPADSGNGGSAGGGAGWGMTGFGGGLGLGGGGGFGGGSSSGGGGSSGGPKGMSLAQRMLEKMGWKEGEGLGRNRQGMATPLMMQKTDVRSGVIVNAAPGQASNPAPAAAPVAAGTGFGVAAGGEQPAKRQRSATFNRPPTRVVLLTNMIGPGEVDKELDREVGEECSKYGAVTNVMIFEVTEAGFPSDQAVRIFVQFDRTEAATKALVDLQGRFFGGREVAASFFEEDRFEQLELAPRPEEVTR
ncbi:DNA-damage-repair/toleration protein [Chlorella vulgaris]